VLLAASAHAKTAEKPPRRGREDPGRLHDHAKTRVPAEVRADYEAGVRQLEERHAKPAIALLAQVTAKAPALTAAHIDLGIATRAPAISSTRRRA
jgi:hypothetical protein